MPPSLLDRDLRQRDILPPARLAKCRVTVIGVGAIGRQVALQLAAIGVASLQLIDFDTVEAVNLAPQGYMEDDLGMLKVEATGALAKCINSQIHVDYLADRFRRSMDVGNVVFCCVDSIATRKLLWEALSHRVAFFGDARMSAEVIRVLTACDAAGRRHYPTTLFAAAEAFAGSYTAKSTLFTASIAAGLLVSSFSQWLRQIPPEPDLTLNLLSSELTTAERMAA